jgi:Peptidase family M23
MLLRQPAPQQYHRGWDGTPGPTGHRGLDYGWASGDIVTVAADGVVEYVYEGGGYNQGWGNRVIIRHSDRSATTYNHLATGTIPLKKGRSVRAGDIVGQMGNTGLSTGVHLHFELYVDGVRVNPVPYFTKHLPGTEPAPEPPVKPPALGEAQRVVKHKVNARTKPTTSGKVTRQLAAGVIGNFDGFIRGELIEQNGVKSNIWFRGAYNGEYFWAGNFTSRSGRGLKDLGTYRLPAPKPKKLALPAYYWYKKAALAAAHQSPRGGKYTGEPMLKGTYIVLGTHVNGAFQVHDGKVGAVWVSPVARKYLVK